MALLPTQRGSGPACLAELLYFRDGGRVQAPAFLERGRVRVATPFGRFLFPESAFQNIVPGHDPCRDREARRAKALAGDADARLEAAWWALTNGLVEDAEELIRSARDAGPAAPAVATLNATLDRLAASRPDPDTRRLEEALGVPLRSTPGGLVLLLHQHDEPAARARLAHLERVVRAFYLWFSFLGVTLDPPPARLPFVQLRDRGDYVRFLSTQNAGAFSTTQGYYHPTFRAVVARDIPGAPTPAGDPSDSATDPADRTFEGPGTRRLLLAECERSARELGIAAHEMVHLLTSASGLDPDSSRLPLWLHEGLAAQFEVVRGGRWAGIGRAHDLRLDDWRAIAPPPALAPLIRDEGFGRGYRPSVYAASWSLVTYLTTARPAEFVAYLDALRHPVPEPLLPRGDRSEACFRRAFGSDLAPLESAWHASTAAMSTPLESHLPAPGRQNPPGRD